MLSLESKNKWIKKNLENSFMLTLIPIKKISIKMMKNKLMKNNQALQNFPVI